MKHFINAQFLEYRCEHCGFGWCELDEVIDADNCPNCGTLDIAPSRAHSLRDVDIAAEARP